MFYTYNVGLYLTHVDLRLYKSVERSTESVQISRIGIM